MTDSHSTPSAELAQLPQDCPNLPYIGPTTREKAAAWLAARGVRVAPEGSLVYPADHPFVTGEPTEEMIERLEYLAQFIADWEDSGGDYDGKPGRMSDEFHELIAAFRAALLALVPKEEK